MAMQQIGEGINDLSQKDADVLSEPSNSQKNVQQNGTDLSSSDVNNISKQVSPTANQLYRSSLGSPVSQHSNSIQHHHIQHHQQQLSPHHSGQLTVSTGLGIQPGMNSELHSQKGMKSPNDNGTPTSHQLPPSLLQPQSQSTDNNPHHCESPYSEHPPSQPALSHNQPLPNPQTTGSEMKHHHEEQQHLYNLPNPYGRYHEGLPSPDGYGRYQQGSGAAGGKPATMVAPSRPPPHRYHAPTIVGPPPPPPNHAQQHQQQHQLPHQQQLAQTPTLNSLLQSHSHQQQNLPGQQQPIMSSMQHRYPPNAQNYEQAPHHQPHSNQQSPNQHVAPGQILPPTSNPTVQTTYSGNPHQQGNWATPARPYSPQSQVLNQQPYRTPPPLNPSRNQTSYQGTCGLPSGQYQSLSQQPHPNASGVGSNSVSPQPSVPSQLQMQPGGNTSQYAGYSPQHQPQRFPPYCPPRSPVPSSSPQPPQTVPSPHQESVGQNSNDSSTGVGTGLGATPGTPNPLVMRPTPSPTGSSSSRSLSPAVSQQSISMPPRPSSSHSQSSGQHPPGQTIAGSSQQQQLMSGIQPLCNEASIPQRQIPITQSTTAIGANMAVQGSYQAQPLPTLAHMHPYKLNTGPPFGGPGSGHQGPYPPSPNSQQYSHGSYSARPQYSTSYGPQPATQQPPGTTGNTSASQYSGRAMHNHSGGPPSPFQSPYQQNWQPGPIQNPGGNVINHSLGKSTPPPQGPAVSQIPTGSSARPVNHLKQHLLHKGNYTSSGVGGSGSSSPTPPQPYSGSNISSSGSGSNSGGTGLPLMGPPHHMAPPHSHTTMGPPSSTIQTQQQQLGHLTHGGLQPNSLIAGSNVHNSHPETGHTIPSDVVSQDNGVSSSGSSGLSQGHPVTSIITTGPDGNLLDEASQQSTLSNASGVSTEDSLSVTPKPRKNESMYSQSHLAPPAVSSNTLAPSSGIHHGPHDDFEMGSSTWARTPASPGFSTHGAGETIHRPSKKSDSLCKLYDMDDNLDRRGWLDKLLGFMDERRTPITACPTISKQPLDLYKLYMLVRERGGFVEVCKVTKSKTWKDIAGLLGIGASSSAAYTLRKHYTKNLLAYECHFDRGGIDPLPIIQQVEAGSKKKTTKIASVPSPDTYTKGSSNSQDSFPPPGSGSGSMDGYGYQVGNTYPNAGPGYNEQQTQMQRPSSQNPHSAASYQGQANFNQYPGSEQYSGPYPPSSQTQIYPTSRPIYPQYGGTTESNESNSSQTSTVPPTAIGIGDPYRGSYGPNASGSAYPPPSQRNYPGGNSGMHGPAQTIQQQQLPTQQPHTSGGTTPTSSVGTTTSNQLAATSSPGSYSSNSQFDYRHQDQTSQPRRHPDFTKDQQSYSPLSAYGQRPQPYAGWQNSAGPGQYSRTPYSGAQPTGTQQWNSSAVPRPNCPSASAQQAAQWERFPPQPNQQAPYQGSQQGQPQWQNMSSSSTANSTGGSGCISPNSQLRMQQPNSSQPQQQQQQQQQPQQQQTQQSAQLSQRNVLSAPGKSFNMQLPPQQPQMVGTPSSKPTVTATTAFTTAGVSAKREIVFPSDSIEGTLPILYRRKRLCKSDIGSIDPWRLFMCLQSGLLAESTWALDVLNILLFDDTTIQYFGLSHLPGLLTLLLDHFQKSLSDIFEDGTEHRYGYGWHQAQPDSIRTDNKDIKCNKTSFLNSTNNSNGYNKLIPVDLGQVYEPSNPNNHVLVLSSTQNYTMTTRKGIPVKIVDAIGDIFVTESNRDWDFNSNTNFQMNSIVGGDPWTYGQIETHPYDHIIDSFRAENINIPFSKCLHKIPGRNIKVQNVIEDTCEESVNNNKISDMSYNNKVKSNTNRELKFDVENDEENEQMSTSANTNLGSNKNQTGIVTNELMDTADKSLEQTVDIAMQMDSDCREVDMDLERTFNGSHNSVTSFDLDQKEIKEIHTDDKEIAHEIVDKKKSTLLFNSNVMIKRKRRFSTYEDECYARDEATLHLINETQDTLARRCICISNILRNLTFVPGNEIIFANSETFLAILGKLLLLHHDHPLRTQKTRNYDREDDTDFADSCSSLQGESEWWWDYLIQLRENMMVAIANIAGHMQLSNYEEIITRPTVDALLHWAVCPSAHGQDPFPSCAPHSALSPQRLALEALCKLCVTDSNVDLVIATPPFSRLEKLCSVLTRHLCRNEDQVLREFSVNLLHYLAAADSAMSRTVALQQPCISYLVGFIEQAEQTALGIANQHGINYLRENPDSMGTSLDMLRRTAGTLLHLARHPDNRPLFLQQEQRLLGLVMSHILDQQVALIISRVLFQVSRGSGQMTISEFKSSGRRKKSSMVTSFSSTLPIFSVSNECTLALTSSTLDTASNISFNMPTPINNNDSNAGNYNSTGDIDSSNSNNFNNNTTVNCTNINSNSNSNSSSDSGSSDINNININNGGSNSGSSSIISISNSNSISNTSSSGTNINNAISDNGNNGLIVTT